MASGRGVHAPHTHCTRTAHAPHTHRTRTTVQNAGAARLSRRVVCAPVLLRSTRGDSGELGPVGSTRVERAGRLALTTRPDGGRLRSCVGRGLHAWAALLESDASASFTAGVERTSTASVASAASAASVPADGMNTLDLPQHELCELLHGSMRFDEGERLTCWEVLQLPIYQRGAGTQLGGVPTATTSPCGPCGSEDMPMSPEGRVAGAAPGHTSPDVALVVPVHLPSSSRPRALGR